MYATVNSDVSTNDLLDSKAIYSVISLSNFTNNKEASESANSLELRVLRGNRGNEIVVSPFRIRKWHFQRRFLAGLFQSLRQYRSKTRRDVQSSLTLIFTVCKRALSEYLPLASLYQLRC